MSTELQTTGKSQITRPETFAPRSLAEAFQFADIVLMSGMAPKSYLEIYSKAVEAGDSKELAGKKAQAAVVVAVQFGMEVGFQPMQALQCIANINGNPSVWGDGALALVQSSGLMEWIKEEDLEVIKKNKKATCQVKRRGDPEVKTVTFSYEDAEKAGIMSRGVWKTYPYRMCMMRSRAFALRDKFPDVLKGLKIAEEVMDYVDPEPQPDSPRIQATVVVPQQTALEAKPETAQAEAKPAEAQQSESKTEEEPLISKEQAVAYYRAYSGVGKLPEESKNFLQDAFGIDNSLKMKVKDYEAAMVWAKTPRQAQENPDSEPLEQWTGELPQE